MKNKTALLAMLSAMAITNNSYGFGEVPRSEQPQRKDPTPEQKKILSTPDRLSKKRKAILKKQSSQL